jgi:transducin (beta)-like 1
MLIFKTQVILTLNVWTTSDLTLGFNHSAFTLRNEGRLRSSPYFSKHIPRGELIELLTKSLLYMEVESHWKGDELLTNCKTSFSLLEHHVCSLEEPQAKSTTAEEPTGTMNVDAMPNSANGPQSSSSSSTLTHAKDALDGKVAIRNGPAAPSDIPVHEQVLQSQRQALAPVSVENANAKRKTSPLPTDEGQSEKRQRRASADMDVDTAAVGMFWSVHLYDSGLIQVVANPDGSPTGASYDNFTGQKYITKAFIRPQGPGDQTDSRIALMLTGHKSEVFVCAFNPKKHNILASG